MAEESNHVKLGVLAIAAIAAVTVIALVLGLRAVSEPTVSYHTYFDESVQGLDLGAPVKYRGVTIGSVQRIGVAPDRRRVDVTLAIRARDARELGPALGLPGLRAQLATQGITGVKFVDMDVFDPETNPPPELPFRPAPNYIPARPSLLKGLTDILDAVGQRLPQVTDDTARVLSRMDRLLDEVGRERLPQRVGKAVDGFDAAIADLRHVTGQLRDARLDTLVASARHATESLGDLGRDTSDQVGELGDTIHDLGEAARSIRDLVQMIEREPDILIKGRARSKGR
ncbi:MAG TPA: MlaD family protein [Kofleriaceae bacterium]